MKATYDPVPQRPGQVVTAAAWKWDPSRNRYRLQQVRYEPKRGRTEPVQDAGDARRRGLLL